MANQNGGGNGGVFFVAGAMVLAAGLIAFFALGGVAGDRKTGAKTDAPKAASAP